MVTAVRQPIACGVTNYSLSAAHTYPSNLCKNLYEIAVSGSRGALSYCNLATMNKYQRGGGTGEPRFWTVKGVDENRNPRWEVWPTPVTADASKEWVVTYYMRPKVQTMTHLSGSAVESRVCVSAEIPFDSQLVINGLYSRVLEEEGGGGASRESLACFRSFINQLQEELNRYNADSGSGEPPQLQPLS
jgi:hypothetical protein